MPGLYSPGMIDSIYSIPLQKDVPLSAVNAMMQQTDITKADFLDNCLNIFPAVAAPMTQGEIESVREISRWSPTAHHGSLKSTHMQQLFDAYAASKRLPLVGTRSLIANKLPRLHYSMPLVAKTVEVAGAVYGTGRFYVNHADILKRDMNADAWSITGGVPHNDIDFEDGFTLRTMSVFSLTHDDIAKPKNDNWTTHYYDMRGSSIDDFISLEADMATSVENEEPCEALASRPLLPLPANQHVIMPTWFPHKACGEEGSAASTSPANSGKAFIGHLIAHYLP